LDDHFGRTIAEAPAGKGWRPRRIFTSRNLAPILGGILLVVCIFGLLFLNFRASSDLRKNLLRQFRQEAELEEKTLRYFFSDAMGRINTLSRSREVDVFFENKALGMSMEYGLTLSLPPIRSHFLDVVQNHLIQGKPVFLRIVLIDKSGNLLVDAAEDAAAKTAASWASFLSPPHRKATILAAPDGGEVTVSTAYYLRGRYEGQIVAWINPKVLMGLLRDDRLPGRIAYLTTVSNEVPSMFRGSFLSEFRVLPMLPSSPDAPTEFPLEMRDGTTRTMVGIRLPIEGTPYSSVLMADAPDTLGRLTPQHLFAGMGLGTALVLAGCAYLFFLTVRSSLLKERLEHSVLREEALQSSEARFRALIENAQDAIVVIDERGAVRFASPSIERVTGYSPAEMLGTSVFDRLDSSDMSRNLSLLSMAIANPGAFLPKPREIMFRHKDTTLRNLEFVGRNFLTDSRIGGIVLNVRDITERRKAEKSQTLLSRAVEQAGEMILITDTQGIIQYANPAFEKITGFSIQEALGKTPRILKSGKHPLEYYRSLWDALARGETWSGNFVNRRKDGTTYEEVAVISPVRDSEGRIINYVAVKRDVTSEKQMEEQLLQAVKMEAVGKLAGGIAHDFNNLLTGIMGYSELLLQGIGSNSGMEDHLQEIRKAAERASALTRQLLAFSRKQIIQPRLLDLHAVIANLDKMMRRVIGEDIELSTVTAKDLWKIKMDPGQIEQVILNLAVNARDSMPQGGKLAIETSNARLDHLYARKHQSVKQGEYVMLAVSDTGCGIPREIQHRIFDPFFTTKEQGKGTGLGLSTVYGIVKQNMGDVWVYSEPDKGTTFKIYFPREDGAPEKAPREDRGVAEAERGWQTLLVAEDDDMVRELIRAILTGSGYKVLDAKDGMEAWEIAQRYKDPIHMLVTDVVMPRMGGRELANLFTGKLAGAKVLFLSGYTDDSIVRHGVLEAGVEFLQKPFRTTDLVQRIQSILDN